MLAKSGIVGLFDAVLWIAGAHEWEYLTHTGLQPTSIKRENIGEIIRHSVYYAVILYFFDVL